MFQLMIIKAALTKHGLAFFILILLCRNRMLLDRIAMSILYRFRRFQVWLLVVLDFFLVGVAVVGVRRRVAVDVDGEGDGGGGGYEPGGRRGLVRSKAR
jgi:hypothetical protein